jgi:GntR family transcriptional regulator
VTQGFVPRYYEIEQSLRARIAALEAGAPLPSDAQLCEEFGVSRMTARNAVQRLVQEGLAYRIPGRGTFVGEGEAHRHASKLVGFSDEMRRRGLTPTSRLLERTVRAADEREARRLELRAGSDVVAVRRVRLADDQPVALETAVLPAAVAPAVLAADLETGSLHAALVAGGFTPSAGRGTIEVEAASTADSRALDVPRGSPLLVERRLIADQHGTPLELTESRYAHGRYAIDVDFVVLGPGAA